ncbi:hypothetical protein C8D88_101604 [Lentzea atacamensis]|uniref:Uncharacterized protein n=2 Tax=Lentzea TaxID=165301 RepID=A0A316IDC1_9PSEU|nr:hypothetical protein [Lentzea atacamensis]PWK90586.1 hypothetical protein C8D88_101604 [Lentzea atacamensis]RAS68190.1 hypothetical protein C8D87_102253 [Lentzea atacamensis]
MEDSYVTFLVLGIVLVVVDGQLIYHSGKGYLRRAYDDEQAGAMMRLTAVLFHLVVLGLLALVSIINVETGDPVKNVVVKLGVVLLLLALAHGVTMAILSRIRDRQIQQQLADQMAEEHRIYEERHAHIGEPRPAPKIESPYSAT